MEGLVRSNPTMTSDMSRSLSADESSSVRGTALPHPHGIYRSQAPSNISLSPVRLSSTFLPSPSRDHHATTTPTNGAASPRLISANELPDDLAQASNVVHLFAPPLAPAWSPVSMSRSQSSRTDDTSTYFPSAGGTTASHGHSYGHSAGTGTGTGAHTASTQRYYRPPMSPSARSGAEHALSPGAAQQRISSPRSPTGPSYVGMTRTSSRQRSPEHNIFERDIELCGSPHLMTPKEAIDVAVPPVLDDAADAIVGDSTLEIVSPCETSSPYASPDMRPHLRRTGTGGEMLVRGASHDGTHMSARQRTYGHRRLHSEQSMLLPSIPNMPSSPAAGKRRSHMQPPSQTHSQQQPPTPNASTYHPSLSIDGAVIPEGQAATFMHSLDGLADAVVHRSPSTTSTQAAVPGSTATPASPVPAVASPSGSTNGSQLGTSSSSYFSLSEDPRNSKFRYSVIGINATPSGAPSDSPTFGRTGTANNHFSSSVSSPRSSRTMQPSLSWSNSENSSSHLQVPGALNAASPNLRPASVSNAQGDRKRLSWMSYADIVNDVNEKVHDLDVTGRV